MGPIKFIHAADIHLDSPLQSLVLSDEVQVARMRRACREAFEALVDYAIEQRAAFVILAGDLYDHDAPNMQIAVFLRTQLSRLDKNGIRVVIAKGNHDADNRITSALALPKNTHILSDRKPETILYDDLPTKIAIHGQSFKAGPVLDNLTIAYPSPISGHLNIGVLHTSLAGSVDHDPYAPCKLEDLVTKGYDYWALGHIHKAAILACDPWVVYPGNLQGRHAKEIGPKGCVLVTVEDDKISTVENVDLDVVRWQLAEIDLSGAGHETDFVERARASLGKVLRDAAGRPTAVRVLLSGTTPLFQLVEGRPKRTLQSILELASEIGGEDIWIEKIQNDTRMPAASTRETTDEGDIIRIIEDIAAEPSRIAPLLKRELEPLRGKLPEDLKDITSLTALENEASLGNLINRMKPRLASLLSGEEDV